MMMVRSWNSGCWLVCWVFEGRFSSDGERDWHQLLLPSRRTRMDVFTIFVS
jgi:hypothetical protein